MIVARNMLFVFLVALTSCGGAAAGSTPAASPLEPSAHVSPFRYAGPARNSPEFPEFSARGAALFDDVCGVCHDAGEGIRGQRFTVAHVASQIRNGSGRMRPIPESRVSDEELHPLLAYLATIDAVDLATAD